MKHFAHGTIAALCLVAACTAARAEAPDAIPADAGPYVVESGNVALAGPMPTNGGLPSTSTLAMYGLAGAGLLYRRWLDGRSAA